MITPMVLTGGWAKRWRPFAKVWFEVVRNLFVVALLSYVASKSDYWFLKAFSFVTTVLFGFYCMSFVIQAMPVTNSKASNVFVRRAANLLGSAMFVFTFYIWSHVLMKVFDEVTKIQH